MSRAETVKPTPITRIRDGGIVQYRWARVPSERDLKQTALVASICKDKAFEVARDYGSQPEGCAKLLQERIGGYLVRGEFRDGAVAHEHCWVEKDESLFDASAFTRPGSAGYLVLPKESEYVHAHYVGRVTLGTAPRSSGLAKYL